MRRLVTLFLPLLVLFYNSSTAPSDAWQGLTHKKMASDAYFIMPAAFRQFLGETLSPKRSEPNLLALLQGAIEPDTVLKDFHNHVYHIQGYDLGNGPFHVASLSLEVTEDIKNKAPISQIVQKLGWLAHYAADLTQPLHTGVSLDNIVESTYHSDFENDVTKSMYSYSVSYDGAKVHERMSAFMIYEALWANQYYSAIETAYTKGQRYTDVQRISATCYSRAVNNIIGVWYTIWANAGGKIDPVNDAKPRFFPASQSSKDPASGLSKMPRAIRSVINGKPPAGGEADVSTALPRVISEDSAEGH
ncbi:MAG: zinc dependent phospholipase C family protein [Candidatus Riflebacteria bacterium]|nr:zinc dependent phospholipase C family protein [Candidatus Riflebacteria bacterium]